MPHNSHNAHSGHTGSSGDDLGSTDEVKIFKDEGDREDEKISSENLLEEKSSLIDLTESEEKSGKSASRQDHSPVFGKVEPHASSFNMGYLVSPYSYTNGAAGGLPVSMANKMGLTPFFCHNGDPLTTPPPAHCGIPPYQLDPKAMGLTRPAIYPFPTSQYPYPMLSPDMSQVAASWHTPSVYSAASSFRSPYPSSLPINTTLSSDFSFRFSPSLLPSVHTPPHHVLNSHPAIVTAGPKQEVGQESNHRYSRSLDQKNSPSVQSECKDNSNEKKKPHIKKPLNAFMLYMKEMRAKVVAECTLKESAAINQILGRRWHALGREEQAKYYELARRERQLHMQMYPDWSSRTNASRGKKRKRKQDTADGGNNMKKCRARFGLDQQNQWCKPCRRKKKCIRYMEVEGEENNGDLDNHVSDDNLGSCGSVDDVKTPEDDTESLNQSLSSPGCLSGLSSLQSPSTSLASPLNLLTSPSTPSTIHNNHEQSQQLHQSQQQYQQIQQQQQQQQQHQLVFTDSTQHQQHITNTNSNQTTINNLEKLKKCTGNSANNSSNINSSNNNNDIMNSSTSNPLTSSSSTSLSSLISSSNAMTNNVLSSTSSIQSPESDEISIKSEKLVSNTSISPLLGAHLAAMGIGPNDRLSPQITPMTSSSVSTSLSNHLFMDNINKLSLTNRKSPHNILTSSANDISDEIKHSQQSPIPSLAMQGNIDDKLSVSSMKLPTNRQQHSHHHNRQQHCHQNLNINQINNNGNSSSSNNNSNITQGISSSLSNSAFSTENFFEKVIRNPVGANPRDVNNPLSVNQLTKRDYSSPAISQQSLSALSSSVTSHQHMSQHHIHMLANISNTVSTQPSSSIPSSLCVTSPNDNLQSLSLSNTIKTEPSLLKTVESNSNHFNICTMGNSNNNNNNSIQQTSIQSLSSHHHSLNHNNNKQHQSHQQQQQQHQGLYQQPSTASSSSSSSSSSSTSSSSLSPSNHQQHNHHHPHHHHPHHHHHLHHSQQNTTTTTALGQHLHHFTSHHFPVVTGNSNNNPSNSTNNITGGITSTKSSPAVPTIGGQSNSTHHRKNDGDNGAISVT